MSEALIEPQTSRRIRARAAWDRELQRPLTLEGGGEGAAEAWFLGPRAENVSILHELIAAAIDSHAEFRRRFHPEDPSHLTPEVRHSPEFQAGLARLRRETKELLDKLKLSAPFASMRYQGHMLWDQALPAIIGQFAATLYNQNNVAAEASPVTTRLEIEAGNDLCRMLGFPVPEGVPPPGTIVPWGHITSGGTVANIEALWAARNLKFAGVAMRAAIREVPLLAPARTLEVPLWGGGTARLVDLDTWPLLNLDLDVLAGLPTRIAALGIDLEGVTQALAGYAVKNVGLLSFYRSFMPDIPAPPLFLAPATSHYSWPKAATLLGLGQNALLVQRVDMDARLDLQQVEVTLSELLRRRVPLLAAVAVIGSTEESAVDPLAELIALRDRYRRRGLNFAIHADAAWGGYFRSMLRDEKVEGARSLVPTAPMSAYVVAQYEALPQADSITVDPHKGGYVPYPAGALCYRNAAFRDAVSLQAPVVFHSQTEPTVGIYGVEGSKPGSAAAAVWLAHRVIRPDRSGYGRILGQCIWTSKRLFSRLATLEDARFSVTTFNRTPAERRRAPAKAMAAERAMLRRFVELNNCALQRLLDSDPDARALFEQIGSDQVILAFALNERLPDGTPNPDLARANALNERVFALCSVIEPERNRDEVELILTSSRFDPAMYGQGFVDRFCRRMGVVPPPGDYVDFLISTTMDPWTTEADGTDFLATIEAALRRAAHRALDELDGISELARSASG
ncbi:MAG TPA: pyridoxal-dependent decarboxylase [Acetobacteraceae bacterium]|nr:pyridoxal-dependent decarboxylase [Acetobacteraceae bacterium]